MTSDEVTTIVGALAEVRNGLHAVVTELRNVASGLGMQQIATHKLTRVMTETTQRLELIAMDTRSTRNSVDEVKSQVLYPNFAKRPRKRPRKKV